MKHFLVFLIFIFSALSLWSQMRLTTYNEQEFTGYVIEDSTHFVKIENKTGVVSIIPRTSISNYEKLKSEIILKDGSTFSYFVTRKDSNYLYCFKEGNPIQKFKLTDLVSYNIIEAKNLGYSSLGLTLLQPGGLNILYGYQFENGMMFRLECGYFSTMSGAQANVGYTLRRSESFEHSFSIAAGFSEMTLKGSWDNKHYDWAYAGLTYNLNWNGFFVEIGMTVGEGDFTNPQLLLQFGYVYRFLD